MPPRKSWEQVKKESAIKSHSQHKTQDDDKDQEGKEDTEKPEATLEDAPETPVLLGVDVPLVYDATYQADATMLNRIAVIGNMPIKLPAAGVDIFTKNNTQTFQARRLSNWPTDSTPKVLTETVAPAVPPLPKNWRLKKGVWKKQISSIFRKYTWNGTSPRTIDLNGQQVTMQPGQYVIGKTTFADNQLEYLYAGDVKAGRSSTFVTLVGVTINPVTNPTVAEMAVGIVLTGVYSPAGTASYSWSRRSGPALVIASPTALVTTVSSVTALAGQGYTLYLEVTDVTPFAGSFTTSAQVSFTVQP